jgi:hypothetical protein
MEPAPQPAPLSANANPDTAVSSKPKNIFFIVDLLSWVDLSREAMLD